MHKQKTNKIKKSDGLVKVDKGLIFQNREKEKRTTKVGIANKPFRKTEESLQKSLREVSDYKYALNESSIVAITDQKGIIKYANENFCKISKYSAEELIGRDHRILNSGYHPKSHFKNLWTTIAKGKIWKGEFCNKAKDGSIYWVDAIIVPFLNKEGKPYQYLAIRRDITERKQAEKDLAEKEFFLRESQRAGNIGSYKTNFVTGTWQSSETLDNIFGIDKNYDRNIEGWLEIVHPDDKQKMDEYLRLEVIGKRKSFNREYRIKRINDKQTKWVCGMGDLKFDDSGNVTELIGIIQDITERKRAEEDLAELNQFNKQIIDSAQDGIIVYDLNMRYLVWNPFMEKITGMPASQVLGKHPSELFPFLKAAGVIESFKKALAGEIVTASDFYFNIPGTELSGWAFDTNAPLKNSKGEIIGVIGVVRDITERKKAEEKIRESNKRYEFVNKATQDTIWEWDYRTKKGKWGEGFITTFGYSADKLKYDETWLDEYVHPDDKERLLKNIRDRIENSLQNCQNEYRFRCADGTYKYVFDRGYILYDENIKPYRMIGAMTDLTEKKRMEKELAEQQIKQQKLITETTIQVQEKEKNELGRELHDNINQILATVKMYLGMAKAKENVSVDLVGQSYEYVNEAMEEIRKLSHSLVAPSLGDIDLKEALQGMMENANLFNNLQVQLLFDEKYNEKNIDKNKELMFYRIVQAQINNIIKHAKANKVVISLKTDNDNLVLTVTDDGVGFDVTQKSKGIGLKNISSRVEFYSGNMNIISAPDQGCTLEVSIPC